MITDLWVPEKNSISHWPISSYSGLPGWGGWGVTDVQQHQLLGQIWVADGPAPQSHGWSRWVHRPGGGAAPHHIWPGALTSDLGSVGSVAVANSEVRLWIGPTPVHLPGVVMCSCLTWAGSEVSWGGSTIPTGWEYLCAVVAQGLVKRPVLSEECWAWWIFRWRHRRHPELSFWALSQGANTRE